jgi:copper chaperone CopZ
MKRKNIILTAALALCALVVNAQSVKTETIKVYGNCAQCRSHIQKAATAAGATEAKWNVDTKILTVTFDQKKTSSQKIQQKIADAGYDTRDVRANDAAYNNLEECCQYDRKKKS